MRKYSKLLMGLFAVVAVPVGLAAQATGTITGQVLDAATQRPLPSAIVQVTGTQARANTDAEGRYTIRGVPVGSRSVAASLVGRAGASQTVNVVAGGTATANFALAEQATLLDAIVVSAVTGREERRREIGANVASIPVADIQKAQIRNAADVLTGRAAGVNVQGASGTTGTAQRIRIRGANSLSLSNEPLIYVDGVLFNNQVFGLGVGGQASSRLNDINPNDIENVEILKGPAASAQYGTAAANGVILITTRRGRAGAPKVNAYVETGRIETTTQFPANFLAYQVNTPNTPLFNPTTGVANVGTTATSARQACPNFLAATGGCRQDSVAVFNTLMDPQTTPFSTGNRQRYGVSVSGGNVGLTYFVSGDIEQEQGVISVNQLDKVNLRTNLTANLTDKISLGASAAYVDSDLAINSNDNSVFSPLINGYVGRAFFNPDTTTAIFNRNYRAFSPRALEEFTPGEGIDRFTGGLNGTIRPLSWLAVNANTGLDLVTRFYQYTFQPGRSIGTIAPGSIGIGGRYNYRSNNYLYSANASGTGTFDVTDRLVSTTTLGASYNRNLLQATTAEGYGIVEGTRDLGTATGQFTVDEIFNEVITIGGFAQQNFAYADRLFLSLGARADRNSSFGAEFGSILYPSASLSWVVSEEDFFPQNNIVSNLRLRAAYGVSGRQPDFRDAETLFGAAAVQVAGQDLPSVVLNRTGNIGLRPERSTEYEGGFEAGFFGDRLGLQAAYYTKTTSDQLIALPIPPSFGFTGTTVATSTRLENIGQLRNSGLELQLNARVLDSDRTRLNMRLSTTTLNNEIISIGGERVNDILVGRGDQRHREGFPAGAFFLQQYSYNDDNGDGRIAQSEVKLIPLDSTTRNGQRVAVPNYIGPALPTLTNSLSTDLTLFKFITVATLFEQRSGNYQFDFTEEFRCRTSVLAFSDRGCEAVYSPTAPLDRQAAYVANRFYGTRAGYVKPADFVKWRELSLTLGVPEGVSFRLLRGASLTLAGRNLRTWTNYTGTDPEVSEFSSGAAGNFTQNEFNTQPPNRYYTARLNFTF